VAAAKTNHLLPHKKNRATEQSEASTRIPRVEKTAKTQTNRLDIIPSTEVRKKRICNFSSSRSAASRAAAAAAAAA